MNGIPFRNDLMKKNEIENEIFMKFYVQRKIFFTSFFVFFLFSLFIVR